MTKSKFRLIGSLEFCMESIWAYTENVLERRKDEAKVCAMKQDFMDKANLMAISRILWSNRLYTYYMTWRPASSQRERFSLPRNITFNDTPRVLTFFTRLLISLVSCTRGYRCVTYFMVPGAFYFATYISYHHILEYTPLQMTTLLSPYLIHLCYYVRELYIVVCISWESN